MNESSENRQKPSVGQPLMPCPSPDQWEEMLGPKSIMQSFDGRLDAHVEHCSKCRAYLEQRSAAHPGLSLISLAGSLAQPPAPLPVSMAGIAVPVGYLAIGAPVYGGRGLVFKALHLASGRHVAIKMSKFRHDGNETERNALEREARTAAGLEHPNIVQIYQVLAESESPAIVMEWVEGGTLLDVLKNRRPSIAEIVHLMKQLADAVGHAHQHLVLHRDIKPSNILMAGGDFNQAKLSDFGLAKLGQADEGWSTATEFIGTPVYMAPESFRKETGKIGPTVDIYSLGAVLYRLLSGKVPFEGANPIELGMRVVQEEVTPIRQFQKAVPKDLETICLKCLRKEPEERYPDAAALKADLVRFEEGKPVRASRDGTITRWRRWARRDPRAARQAAAFGIFLIGVIIALAVLLERSRKSEQLAVKYADQAQKSLSASLESMSLASPIFKRILHDTKLKDDEYSKINKFARLWSRIEAEPVDLKERLKFHFLKLELADSLISIPGYEAESIEWASLAREKIKQFIEENADEAAHIVHSESKATGFRQTLLETALIQYSYACSQLYNAYPDGNRIGMGIPVPEADPNQSLLKDAIASAERVLQLNPKLSEPRGQIADYYMAMGQNALAAGDRAQAVAFLEKALPYSEGLRDEYIGDLNRWVSALWHRQFLAMTWLEPPARFQEFEAAVRPQKIWMKSDRLKNLKNRADIEVRLWLELRWQYLPMVAKGDYHKAKSDLDEAIALFPRINDQTLNAPGARKMLNIIKTDRLSLLKIIKIPQQQLEAETEALKAEMEEIGNTTQKALAMAYFNLFRPEPEKRNAAEAARWLGMIREPDDEIRRLLEISRILTGDMKFPENYADTATAAAQRCEANVTENQKLIFEAERLVQIGQRQAAAERMKSIEAWLENDKLAPCFLRLRVEELRRRLIH